MIPTLTAGRLQARLPYRRPEISTRQSGLEVKWLSGVDSNPITNTGGRYNPDTDTWTATSITNAPEAGLNTTPPCGLAARMIVWGGTDHFTWFNTGGRYNPGTNSWASTSTVNAPSGRETHTAVWSDSRMIVWGGYMMVPIKRSQHWREI